MEELTRLRALKNGYCFAGGLLDAATLRALRDQVLAVCKRRDWLLGCRGFAHDSPEFVELQLEVQSLAAFDALRADARLCAVLKELLGGNIRDRQGDVCRVVFPDAPEFATPAHQDQTYLKRTDEVWAAWIPLEDCPRRQGSLAVVPRSRQFGLVSAVPRTARWRTFDFAVGDVLFVHPLTIHRALVNRSSEIRVSVDLRYSRASSEP
jgi:ectoine hydroxylase-related dioxygenase (phytanoyl-CoA dioxygenase family)